MNNLFDIIMQAQNGDAVDRLSRQFNLSREQTEQAIELLMPAFSKGLKRNTADPASLMNFMSELSSGRHQKFHDNADDAFQREAIDEGNAILGQLFGSKDTSRAVADQVAFASGIGPTILKQMLPVIASMIMGGLFKNAAGGRVSAPANPMGDLLGGFLENMMKGGMGNMAQPQRQDRDMGENPFGRMMEDFLGSAMGGNAPSQAPRPPEKGEDVFGDMFETGRKVQDQYQRNIDNIFDQFLDGMRR